MPSDSPSGLILELDDEHAVKLARVAERLELEPEAAGRCLLYAVLDQIEPDEVTITSLLDAIPGAWDDARLGLADVKASRTTHLDYL